MKRKIFIAIALVIGIQLMSISAFAVNRLDNEISVISAEIKEELKEKVAEYKKQGVEITLAVVKVGNDPASAVYVRNKEKACEYVGITCCT